MKRKKIAALFVTASLCIGMVAGMTACGGGGDDAGGNTGGGSTGGGAAAGGTEAAGGGNAGGEAGDAGDDKSPITFTYYSADARNDNWDNPVAQAITEATGVTLDISYPVTTSGDPQEDISLMIAEGKYPDLIYSKGSAGSLYEAGALIDMRDLIEQYGPNIKKCYGDEFEKLKWGDGDDGIYQLCYLGVNGRQFTTGGTAQIQWAAIKDNNYEYPTTLEEFEATIKAYLAEHPTTEDGLPTIGITQSASDWHWLITLSNPSGFIADEAPDHGIWLVDDDYNVTYKHTTENNKEYYRWLSRMYDEGILDPEFATQTDDDYIAKIASGRVVALTDSWWHYAQAEATLKAEGMIDKTYCPLPMTLKEGQKCPTLMYQGLQVGYGVGISVSCEDPVRAIKFLDYMCSTEGAVLYRWGIEGEHYFLDENGKRYRTEEEIQKATTDPDYAKKTGIGNLVGFPVYSDGAMDENGDYMTPTTKESTIANYNEEQIAACEAWGVEMLTDIFPQPEEFETPPYSPLWAYATPQQITNDSNIISEIAWPGLVKCVTDSVDNFDANWDAMQAEMEANGLHEVEQAETDFLKTKLE